MDHENMNRVQQEHTRKLSQLADKSIYWHYDFNNLKTFDIFMVSFKKHQCSLMYNLATAKLRCGISLFLYIHNKAIQMVLIHHPSCSILIVL